MFNKIKSALKMDKEEKQVKDASAEVEKDMNQTDTVEENNVDDLQEEVEQELSLEERLEEANIRYAELNDKHIRLFAEFDNYKKRVNRERIEMLKLAGQDVLKDILPVLDDMKRARKNMDEADDVEALRDGIDLIISKLMNTLGQRGLKEMKVVHEVFDPELHEAISEVPAPSEEMKGKVLDEVERGYTLNDKIIRFPKVVVGK